MAALTYEEVEGADFENPSGLVRLVCDLCTYNKKNFFFIYWHVYSNSKKRNVAEKFRKYYSDLLDRIESQVRSS